MPEQRVIRALGRLFQIADAGEKGFATAAANMPNPALKIFFKLCAKQRLTFKNELLAEMERLGAAARPGISIPGAIHRGRVAIFAGLAETDPRGQEKVILKEAAIGERAAERTYRGVLALELPEPTRALVERQYAQVSRTSEQVRCLRDDEQRRAAMQVTEDSHHARQAVQSLVSTGYSPDEIEMTDLTEDALYQGRGATLAETILSGAFGGALWGGVMGMAAGIGVVGSTNPTGSEAIFFTWLLTVLGFMAIGMFISSVLALFIGVSVSGEDRYQYKSILEDGRFLVHMRVCPAD
jgi:uncharacterized protein (TIGR02284 family)